MARGFSRHKWKGASYHAAHHMGGAIIPELVVVHDTASRIEFDNAAAYLRSDNPPRVSVHFVIERNGDCQQQVPVNRRANHAGRSHYHGRDWCNGFSVGIELVNPGRMERGREGFALAYWGEHFSIEEHNILWRRTEEHGDGYWMPYTEAQLATLERLLEDLFTKYRGLEDIVPHWYISPGRKIDTNPLFPLDALKARILGRDEPNAQEIEATEKIADGFVAIEVPGDILNMRRWPSFNPNVIAKIPDGTVVPVLNEGEFNGRAWVKVVYAGQEGWVVKGYTASIITRDAVEAMKQVL
ncbi:N-acetylmuramoyl-L-alanine amidase [Pseudaestuariivita sp.]|uniref:N-acetylmuramoyl-L-alanine amidase n=1 Tax=Pseudaestuariivita sp. TaxID=2211669 RepID=UPI004058CC97